MEQLTFYFDRSFGRRLPEALRRLGLAVEFQHDKKSRFPASAPDDKWLAEVGKRNWVVFSHDQKFHLLPAELSAIKQHNVGCFYLWGPNAKTWDKARVFAKAYDRIVAAVKLEHRPFIYHVTKSGALKKVKMP